MSPINSKNKKFPRSNSNDANSFHSRDNNIYKQYKLNQNDSFKWGDEIEFTLIKFDHVNKNMYVYNIDKMIMNFIWYINNILSYSAIL